MSLVWKLKSKTIDLKSTGTPILMGIVNVTPDSFSDGGHYNTVDFAVEHALQLADDGATIIDVGGESTRPYSTPVTTQEEIERVAPVIEKLARETDLPISVDTSKSQVAKMAVEAGAEIINDVTGLEGDPAMLQTAIDSGAGICVMHMQGNPQTMQDNPQYEDVVEDIFKYLAKRKEHLQVAGIETNRICLDPGIGFGKTHEHNLELMRRVDRFLDLDSPLLVGHSRKGFIGKTTGDDSKEKIAGTLTATLHLARKGVHIIRVHDVRVMNQALKLMNKIEVDSIACS